MTSSLNDSRRVSSNFFSFPTQKRFSLQLFHTNTEDEEVNEKKNYVDDDNDNYGNVGSRES